MITKVLTLNDLSGGQTYDLGNRTWYIHKVQLLGIGQPEATGGTLPPLVSPMNRLDLSGKLSATVVTQKENDRYYIQLVADGQDTPVSTVLSWDIDNQTMLDTVISVQVVLYTDV